MTRPPTPSPWSGEYVDPVSGQSKTMRGVTSYESKDCAVFSYYDTAPDGSDFKSMEITDARK